MLEFTDGGPAEKSLLHAGPEAECERYARAYELACERTNGGVTYDGEREPSHGFVAVSNLTADELEELAGEAPAPPAPV